MTLKFPDVNQDILEVRIYANFFERCFRGPVDGDSEIHRQMGQQSLHLGVVLSTVGHNDAFRPESTLDEHFPDALMLANQKGLAAQKHRLFQMREKCCQVVEE